MRILIAAAITLTAPFSALLISAPAHAGPSCPNGGTSYYDGSGMVCSPGPYHGPQATCSNSMFSTLPKCPNPCSKSQTDKNGSNWPVGCDPSEPMTD